MINETTEIWPLVFMGGAFILAIIADAFGKAQTSGARVVSTMFFSMASILLIVVYAGYLDISPSHIFDTLNAALSGVFK